MAIEPLKHPDRGQVLHDAAGCKEAYGD